jgi:hypothetical protein
VYAIKRKLHSDVPLEAVANAIQDRHTVGRDGVEDEVDEADIPCILEVHSSYFSIKHLD